MREVGMGQRWEERKTMVRESEGTDREKDKCNGREREGGWVREAGMEQRWEEREREKVFVL